MVTKLPWQQFFFGVSFTPRLKLNSLRVWVRVIICNATFNNISVISWQWVLLVEESQVPGENIWLAVTHWETLSHNVVLSTPCHEKDSYWVHLVMRRIHIEYILPWEGFILSTPCHEKDSYWVHLAMRRIHIEYTLPWEGFILSTPCHEKDSYWVHLAMRIHIEYTLPWEGFILSTPCHEKDSYWVHLAMRRIHIEYTLPWEGFILSTPCHEKDSYWVHLAMRRIHIEYTLPWEGFKLTIIKVNKNILIDSTASNCFIVYPIDDNVNVCIKTFKVLDIYQIYQNNHKNYFSYCSYTWHVTGTHFQFRIWNYRIIFHILWIFWIYSLILSYNRFPPYNKEWKLISNEE